MLALDEAQMRGVRGKDIAMVFQEPMTSLNPLFTVGNQLEEAILAHESVPRAEAPARHSSCSMSRASRTPTNGSTITRTNCRAACAKG